MVVAAHDGSTFNHDGRHYVVINKKSLLYIVTYGSTKKKNNYEYPLILK